jgi:uncharacterized membrane protein
MTGHSHHRGMTMRRLLLPCVLVYPVLAIAGAITHRQGLSLAALMVLLTVVLAPALVAGRLPAWLIWTGGSAGMLALASRGLLPVVLDLVPVLVNALLAWFFGRTLLAGRQPLIAHFISAIEGPSRLDLPGVARYARHLTAFWAGLLSAQALVLAFLLVCARPGGLLADVGLRSPLEVPSVLATAYSHLGSYALMVSAFLCEYAFRRVHLRHVPQLSLHQLTLQLAVRWPQLLRGYGSVSP